MIPPGATHLEVVLVFTDVMGNTPVQSAKDPRDGDLPYIIGAFSGDLVDGKWNIKSDRAAVLKVLPRLEDYPTAADYNNLFTKADNFLKERTGARFRARPEGLDPAKPEKVNEGIINDAFKKHKVINADSDTGYDIYWP
jgi:hypothetical protein